MKTKTLALVNGIVGLIGGIVLLLGIWFIFGAAATGSDSALGTVSVLFLLLKLAILALGIVGAVYYKDDVRVSSAPNVLLIVGGAVGLIPFFGWIGGILAIIGGSMYLSALKKFAE
ncbi:hypothetical protein DDV21_001540 [Streptococcus chenjunshii]|uniref:Prophage Lp1 protein 6 n=1 Tax=Streptococcus chenjunshii TaxID=2173853 RepID=A0A372KN99_9STRE|nr:hypothetical protein [Streptococcus chenjunshii]AXQ77844.1 hypothetical protein DDV21_001540 [Streptococcus chenjunshii]RFU51355.1 hypothetical protein DDV22_04195 [Streptococcus chenjunshii]RFU53771.1 hypothetical protein DDV23_02555 [Streptococcus chenjunshii]